LALGECDSNGELWGWFAYPFVMLYAFYILAGICDRHLTTALEFIVERIRMSEDVAGATFLAMASSAPELFTSMICTLVVESESGVGNIVGSALFNLLVIIGIVPALAGGQPLDIWWYPTVRDAFFYGLAIIELWVVLYDGKVYIGESAVMLVTYFLYTMYFTQNRRIVNALGLKQPGETGEVEEFSSEGAGPQGPDGPPDRNVDILGRGDTGGTDSEVSTEEVVEQSGESPVIAKRPLPHHSATENWDRRASFAATLSSRSSLASDGHANSRASRNSFTLRGMSRNKSFSRTSVVPMFELSDNVPSESWAAADSSNASGDTPAEATEEDCDSRWRILRYEPFMLIVDACMPTRPEWVYTMFALCCMWIGVFTFIAVDSTERLGKCVLHIPEVVMGLVFLAAGTSVPDAMGSIAVAKDGMGNMAVANAVGSNTFDILLGLGLPWFIYSLINSWKPVSIRTDLLIEAIIILAGCLAGYLISLVCTKWKLTRNMGFCLLLLYALSIGFILVWTKVAYADMK